MVQLDWSAIAAWVQALGSIAAIGASAWIVQRQHHLEKKLQREAEREKLLERIDVVLAFSALAHTLIEEYKNTCAPHCSALVFESELFNKARFNIFRESLAAFPVHEIGDATLIAIFIEIKVIYQYAYNDFKAVKNNCRSDDLLRQCFGNFSDCLGKIDECNKKLIAVKSAINQATGLIKR